MQCFVGSCMSQEITEAKTSMPFCLGLAWPSHVAMAPSEAADEADEAQLEAIPFKKGFQRTFK